jgi:hypothetical protein
VITVRISEQLAISNEDVSGAAGSTVLQSILQDFKSLVMKVSISVFTTGAIVGDV